ncbi:MAG: hypothetical protein C0501_27810 [Isosphaera sp.]|nr:hypothetical protein [Isosphaera sp.]
MADDDKRQEVDDKVAALVRSRFGGGYKAAFAHYDADGNGVIDGGELKALLSDAGVGSGLSGLFVEAIRRDGFAARHAEKLRFLRKTSAGFRVPAALPTVGRKAQVASANELLSSEDDGTRTRNHRIDRRLADYALVGKST